MKIQRGIISLLAITFVYLLLLTWADTKNQVFQQLPALATVLPVLMAFAFASYVLRYLRWHWLLRRTGLRIGFARGFIAYLAGFAFTATPGKAGELVRIRYFEPLGVSAPVVISAFVYERAFDLIVVLAFASLAAVQFSLFPLLAVFVAVFLGLVVFLAKHSGLIIRLSGWLRLRKQRRLSRLGRVLGHGMAGAGHWMTMTDITVALLLGSAAWGITTLAFVYLLLQLGILLPLGTAVALYPIAMLAGAASMMPGGLGSTEATIVVLLLALKAPLVTASIAAVGIRLASLWFAVFLGLACMAWLESGRTNTHGR